MYLPPKGDIGDEVRRNIFENFQKYCSLIQPRVDEFQGQVHWAKLELPHNVKDDDDSILRMQKRIRNKFPVDEFNSYRKALDPSNIFANKIIDSLFK